MRELQILVQSIVEEDDYALEAADRAMQALSCLKELKLKHSNPQSLLLTLPPPEFRCPLSGQLMIDPVVIASGQVGRFPINLLFKIETFSWCL